MTLKSPLPAALARIVSPNIERELRSLRLKDNGTGVIAMTNRPWGSKNPVFHSLTAL